MSLKIGALFAGYGGLDRAVESVLDSRVSWVAEFDDGPSRILAHRYPDAPNLRDVTQVDWSAVEPVDIITGGSPCQDLSHAGKRAGMKDGTRSGLWAAMCDAVETIRPSLVLWENVRGALSAEATAGDVESCEFCVGDPGEPPLRALGRVLGDLAELGYDAGWCGLRAADVGAPHGRWRVFVVAWPAADASSLGREARRRDVGQGEEVARPDSGVGALPVWGSREWRELTPLLPTPTVSDANGPGAHGDGGLDLRTAASLLPTPRATDGSKGGPNQRGSSDDLMLPSAVTNLNGARDALPPEGRPREDLRDLWRDDGAAAIRSQTRGSNTLPVEEILLQEVREYARRGDEGRAALEGAQAPSVGVLGVLDNDESACPSHRSESGQQRSGEPADPLRVVPPAPPLAGGPGEADGGDGEGASDSARAWGKYAPAVARWEVVLGRPAPSPTEPTGKGGAYRLSARAVEFMMGLPSGWVTDPAIWEGMKPSTARNAQLKALGNGVVPQQAAAAIRHVLTLRDDLDPRKDSAA